MVSHFENTSEDSKLIGNMDDGHNDTTDARGSPLQKRRGCTVESQPAAKTRPNGYLNHDSSKRQQPDSVSEYYNMNHAKRGTAVIINNRDFLPDTRMGDRRGTDVDADNMYKLLEMLGFEKIIKLDNLTAQAMRDVLLEVSEFDHSDSDCFVCVILTHGEDGYIYGTDGKIPVDDLVANFKGHKCPSLAGKPKLYFIQACRGNRLDDGVDMTDAGGGAEAMEEDVVLRRIPREADFLMAYSVISGYYAWRNVTNGSWFIQAIVDVFTENWEKLDVLSMMTRVNRKVAYDFMSNNGDKYYDGKKQIPCITSMLTKDILFAKK